MPSKAASATFYDKKSQFIALLSPTQTEQDALDFLQATRSQHPAANHHVYAYVLKENSRTRYSDDKEPAKTAGLPVLCAIQHAELFNCAVVVCRYFGGTKLGTGGLVRAYTSAASAAISAAGRAQMCLVLRLTIGLGYSFYNSTLRLLQEFGAQILGQPIFAQKVQITCLVLAKEAEPLKQKLQQLLSGSGTFDESESFYTCWQ